jgi:prepilin-type N-terminal cleavage/methylation domain-containing protein/prepilin-type processing-associated H-X9-DG protein
MARREVSFRAARKRVRRPGGRPRVAGSRRGLTMLEVLVAISVIAILAAILLPAVSQAREAARHAQCRSNLHQIGVAIQAHEAARGEFPGRAFTYDILPYIDQQSIYQLWPGRFPDDMDAFNALLAEMNRHQVPLYLCPSDAAPPHPFAGRTNYVGNIGSGVQAYGLNGFFSLAIDEAYRPADFVRRGLSNTAAVSETLGPFGEETPRLRATWKLPRTLACPDELDAFADACERLPRDPADFGYRGGPGHGVAWHGLFAYDAILYNHVLPPNRPHCSNGSGAWSWGCYPAKSAHPGGATVLYGDGHVDFVSESIDRHVWREIGSRMPLEETLARPPARCLPN